MIEFDFIPPDYHAARSRSSAVRVRASLIGVMLMGMSLWVVSNRHELSEANALLAITSQQRQELNQQWAHYEAMEAQRAALIERQERLDLLESRASLVLVLADISRRMPATVFLTELRVTCPSVAAYVKRKRSPILEEGEPPTETSTGAAPVRYEPDPIVTDEVARVVLIGVATDTAEAIAFVKQLEESPLIADVQLKQGGPTQAAGRRGQGFEVTAEISNQTQVRP